LAGIVAHRAPQRTLGLNEDVFGQTIAQQNGGLPVRTRSFQQNADALDMARKREFDATVLGKRALELDVASVVSDREPSAIGLRAVMPSENPKNSRPLDGLDAPHLGRRLVVCLCHGIGCECTRLTRIDHLADPATEHRSM
jgi:hypothetical protein